MIAPKLYFAYGSNLNSSDWQDWCRRKGRSGAQLNRRSAARLPDYEIAFTFLSKSRAGGVLDVIRRPGQVVDGAIFEPDAAGWDALSAKEGAAYEPMDTVVIDERGTEVPVTTYRVAEHRRQAYVRPNPDYVEVVRSGLRDFSLPFDALDAAAAGRPPEFAVAGFFVYGTLMRGECRFNFMQKFGIQCVLSATSHGRLVDLGNFPGLLDVGVAETIVHGEFIGMRDVEGAVRELDTIEGFLGFGVPGSLYQRKLIEVGVGDGSVQPAWAYCYARNARSAATIPSGDWRLHRDRRDGLLALVDG